MNDSPPLDPRRRLRELLTIPERDRTDEQWDEIIELEITLAPATVSPSARRTGSPNGKRRSALVRRVLAVALINARADQGQPDPEARPAAASGQT
jgi:hypothetical protein